MTHGQFGTALLVIGLISSLLCIGAYVGALFAPVSERRLRLAGRTLFTLTAASILWAFATLGWIVFNHKYQYSYAFEHTDNSLGQTPDILHFWLRIAATWSGQEGSFLLWASWTAVIGFLVFARASKYEARVMPFFVSVLSFLCAILIKQSPFLRFLAVYPEAHTLPFDGRGLNQSLQNYWMTIHPPTIFFGFASLAVPYSYAVAALIWKDYKGWTTRVMPYALLTCATLGLGLFMGGYWAYETQGWHGFWAWDPVENASFFPWLAITALVHGLVVQKSRGGMARTTTFLGIFAFWLFLLGTFLTRSGALSSKGSDGQMLSVHAFDNISKSGLVLMTAMLVVYGLVGLSAWLFRLRSMPTRPTTGDTLISRDFAFFMAMLLMIVACLVVTLGSTTPLFLSWMHRPPSQPQPAFYNKVMIPITLVAAFCLGVVPWLAWRKTDSEKFLRKLLVPWFGMLVFGFALLIWVQSAERGLQDAMDAQTMAGTLHAWIAPWVQRLCVVALGSLGFLAALSNAMLAYRVFRSKPLAAGGWLAHVGIGLLIVGVIVSNTYERTQLLTLDEGDGPKSVFGYQIAFEGMSGKPVAGRPTNPEYDPHNEVKLRITPPGADNAAAAGSAQTFLLDPRWFAAKYNPMFEAAGKLEPVTWPAIKKYLGHDLYIGLADTPGYNVHVVKLKPGNHTVIGSYDIFYLEPVKQPGQLMEAKLYIKTADGKIITANPGIMWARDDDGKPIMGDEGQPILVKVDETIPELQDSQGHPGAIILESLNAGDDEAELAVSLPDAPGTWRIPLAVTYKPWVNLVWIGVLIAVMGTLLAMVRRLLEARRGGDDGDNRVELPDLDPDTEGFAARSSAPTPVMPIKTATKSSRRQVS